jgi:quercetin dioxygenase-like cupin family protein
MRRINFENLPFLVPTEGVRCQTVLLGGRQIRLIDFAPGFCEKEWCSKAHIGYILAGRLEVEFDNAAEVFALGDGLVIEAGDLHRARVIAGPVRIFLVEDP